MDCISKPPFLHALLNRWAGISFGRLSHEAGEPTVLKLYPLAVSLKGARAGNTDRQVSKIVVYCSAIVISSMTLLS